MTSAGGPPGASRSLLMSAFERNAAVMSAFEGKADMTFCGGPLSRSLFGHVIKGPRREDAVTAGGAFLQLFTSIQETLLGREGTVI